MFWLKKIEDGGLKKEKKRMQQLCRKVCNEKRNAYKASIYKDSVSWFHGKIGHETRGEKHILFDFWEVKMGERGEEEEDKDIELWMHSICYGRAASKN